MSLPTPHDEPSLARSAASPPLEPPGICDGEYGLREIPQSGLEHSNESI